MEHVKMCCREIEFGEEIFVSLLLRFCFYVAVY